MNEMDEGPPTSTITEMCTTYSQVVFSQVPRSFPPNIPVRCHYTVTSTLQPHRRDWVGIFKVRHWAVFSVFCTLMVGWSTTKDYYTFVWANPTPDSADEEHLGPYVIFDAYYLPKEDGEFYQFCYVDSSGQVRGASTPFCFESPVECSPEYSFEKDLLVITTQEQVEQVEKEKLELQKEMEEQREATEILRAELDERLLEIRRLRVRRHVPHNFSFLLLSGLRPLVKCFADKRVLAICVLQEYNADLVNEMGTLKQQHTEKEMAQEQKVEQVDLTEIQTQTEMLLTQPEQLAHHLEVDSLYKEKEDLEETVSSLNERYEKTIMKVNHLKLEQEDLKTRAEAQEEEILQLNLRIRELEQEGLQWQEKQSRLQDQIQLLQVDLQSSQKENMKLCGELLELRAQGQQVQALQSENQVLRRSLSGQEQEKKAETHSRVLDKQLQEAKEQLQQERQRCEDMQRQVGRLQEELQQVQMQLTRTSRSLAEKEQMSSKLECQLLEARRAAEEQMCMAELQKAEKEELLKENEKLTEDIQRLREKLAQVHMVPPSTPASLQNPNSYFPSAATPGTQNSVASSLFFGNPFQTQDDSTDTREEKVCCYCKEAFPDLTAAELEQHEQNHKVCPFCACICDSMEQAEFEEHVYKHED
ncbi:calcium-binding and coiled-coil domain-containing protein 2-like [Scleropages formosus]|uniref:Calcium-binding and coiled-coil domain-containing protein 2-like n=1 Tax=Scleropages formosus TaxID=113540 RepID=A0A0P7V9T8_SCLFO|nr:calcium-binding and coiled-coil domain-containing protein 2-like [Scleropages formosus]